MSLDNFPQQKKINEPSKDTGNVQNQNGSLEEFTKDISDTYMNNKDMRLSMLVFSKGMKI